MKFTYPMITYQLISNTNKVKENSNTNANNKKIAQLYGLILRLILAIGLISTLTVLAKYPPGYTEITDLVCRSNESQNRTHGNSTCRYSQTS